VVEIVGDHIEDPGLVVDKEHIDIGFHDACLDIPNIAIASRRAKPRAYRFTRETNNLQLTILTKGLIN
jgi:hypothetical protein